MPISEWTVMLYLAGDNNLAAAGEKDLAEMRKVGSTDAVQLIAQFDNAGDQGTQRYRIMGDASDDLVADLGETDSGSPEVLIDFVKWGVQTYPAKRYALILWNHGSGWEPSEMDRVAREVGARAYNEREASERSASALGKVLFRTSLEQIFSLPSPADRAICSDDGSGHSLDTIELGKVLQQVVAALGQPLDLLGMDACLMSNLEVAYQVQPYVRYMVASEENEPNDGWPYDAILRQLVNAPNMPTADLAAQIVQAYIFSYVDRGYIGDVTQSAFDLSRIATLTTPLDTLADALLSRMPHVAHTIWTAQRKSTRFWHNTLWDMCHFCEELEQLGDAIVGQAARDMRAALQSDPGNFVIAESHNGDKVGRCGGVSIYLLPPLMDISRYYSELEFAKQHRWLELLREYHAA